MSHTVSNNKRIAKNTIYLYIRTLVVMFVSLYTSRLVLQLLGETDLGIYNLVGGIVSLMAFLQAAQTKATSRFITYELGLKGNNDRLSRIYSICMTIHIILAIVIVIIAETIGLWIVNEYTNIPETRMFVANVVYQFSIYTFVMHFLRCPLDSVIIAQENMSVYAYMSIVEVLLQLGIVVGLLYYNGDKLSLYGGLIFVISIILFVCFLIYKIKIYPQYKYKFIWDKKESLKVLSFSGWTLLGGAANTLTQQGVNILFNNFVGLVANAAMGFASQVNVAVARFVSSFTTAFNPQIIKLEAQADKQALFTLINRASKYSFALCYIMVLPLIANMNFVLQMWLVNVPQYTVEFCQLILICTLFDATTGVFNTTITATGKIKYYQIFIATSFLLDLLCAFVLLKIGCHPAIVFGSRIMTRGVINMFVGFYFAKKYISFPLVKYLKEVLVPVVLTIIISIPFAIFKIYDYWLGAVLNMIICFVVISVCTIFFIMSKNERQKIFNVINTKIYGRSK